MSCLYILENETRENSKNEIVIETSTVIMLFAKSNGIAWIDYKNEMTCILM